MQTAEFNVLGFIIIALGFFLVSAFLAAIIISLPGIVQALVNAGANAREHIDAMKRDPGLYRENRGVSFVTFYAISWLGYLAALFSLVCGLWAVYSILGWMRSKDE